MPTISPAPVRKSVVVKAAPARAFRVFTDGIGRWWPASHTIAASPLASVVIEPRAGGRWFGVGKDGSECEWGRVLAWEPPARLLLAWQIGADWRFDPELVTEVEILFTPQGADATRVDLEHRLLERMGDKADSTRAAMDSPEGWGAILHLFGRAVDTTPQNKGVQA